jgi:hypothetical protein
MIIDQGSGSQPFQVAIQLIRIKSSVTHLEFQMPNGMRQLLKVKV